MNMRAIQIIAIFVSIICCTATPFSANMSQDTAGVEIGNGGFEIGNGVIVNRIGGYRFKLPGTWESGVSGALTQIIAPSLAGVPRPQVTFDLVKIGGNKLFTDQESNSLAWLPLTLRGLQGHYQTNQMDNGLRRTEFRLKNSKDSYFLITVDYGIAGEKQDLLKALNQTLNSFQSLDSD